ncbi:MAG TPA: hypothetical protein VFS62_09780 [Chloroflexota bacterium]|jgi:hypothetical protein|nr:hypothetical protein [Chloroflexota bacterium]
MDTKPTSGVQHPESWREDLNAEAEAGTNRGPVSPHPELDARTAYDVKDLHRQLHDIHDDDLKRIPVLPEGSHLAQGATYIDLRDPRPREFTATGEMRVDPGRWMVRKDSVDYELSNRLIGEGTPAEKERREDVRDARSRSLENR